jgi:hypothetical protein
MTSSFTRYLAAVGVLAGASACSSSAPPEVIVLGGPDGDTIVAKNLTLTVSVRDDNTDMVNLLVDDEVVDEEFADACREAERGNGDDVCFFDLSWDTVDFEDGMHNLVVEVIDRDGLVGEDGIAVGLAQGILVRRIRITDEPNDGAFDDHLEIEVHMRSLDDDSFIGCASERTGLIAPEDDRTFNVEAGFVDTWGDLTFDGVTNQEVVFRVVEDDDQSCPHDDTGDVNEPLFDLDDDLLGVSDPIMISELENGLELSFDDVPELELGVGRVGTIP